MSFVSAQAVNSSLVLDMRAVGVRGEVGQIVRGSFLRFETRSMR
jgi:hypothetical protein